MINSIHFCYAHAAKIKGWSEMEFSHGLNILVGPNGSGKSTVLRALNECEQCEKHTEDLASHVYFNSETMNPHAPDGPPGDMRNMTLRVRAIFSSHGEIMKDALTTIPLRKGETLLVDEPEAGQDMASVRRIREGFDTIIKQGGQVIAATHHPLLLHETNVIELTKGYVEQLSRQFCYTLCKDQQAEGG